MFLVDETKRYKGIPVEMIEHTLAELAREIPSREVLLDQLGPFAAEVQVFLTQAEAITFFTQVGHPLASSIPVTIERVWSWEAAHFASRTKESDEFASRAAHAVTEAIKQTNRQELSDAAFDLYSEYTTLNTFPYETRWSIIYDLQNALGEIITRDVLGQRVFVDKFRWYEAGHWPCASRQDGTLVIF